MSDKIKILTDATLEFIKVAPLVSKEAEQMAKEEAETKAAAVAQAAASDAAGEKPAEGETTPSVVTSTPPPASDAPKKE